jgi:5-methylcytosine-specific restriction enzyme subunit McrC
LLGEHAQRFALQPTLRADVYRVTALGWVGVLPLPTCQLVIAPRLRYTHLAHLLGATTPGWSAPRPQSTLPLTDWLIEWFAQLIHERQILGLPVGYREQVGAQTYLRGRLDILQTLRAQTAHQERLITHDTELTCEVPVNQIVAAALQALRGQPQWATRLAPLAGAWAAVTPTDPGPFAVPPGAETLVTLARWLLTGTQGPAFLLDLARVFERYVARHLSAWPGVEIQPCFALTPDVTIRPDVIVRRGVQVRLIIDTKWKRPTPTNADLYQMLAYALALDAPQVVLLYPGRRDSARGVQLPTTRTQLTVRTLRVIGTAAQLDRSVRRWAQTW